MFIPKTNMDITKYTFLNPAAEGSTEMPPLTYIPQLLAENIQYQYIFRNIHICIRYMLPTSVIGIGDTSYQQLGVTFWLEGVCATIWRRVGECAFNTCIGYQYLNS